MIKKYYGPPVKTIFMTFLFLLIVFFYSKSPSDILGVSFTLIIDDMLKEFVYFFLIYRSPSIYPANKVDIAAER